MIVYRISHKKYASSLLSSGVANRWNRNSQHVIYCSENISLCALELLAHTNGIRPVGAYCLMRIKIAETITPFEIHLSNLPEKWHHLSAYAFTQNLGCKWYDSRKSLCMKVPSVIVPSESNYVINTRHEGFLENVQLIDFQNFFWDHRFPSN